MIIQSTSRSRSGSKYKDCDTNYSTKGTLRWDHFFVFCRQLQMFAFEINGGKQKCFHTEQIHPLHIHVKITKYGFSSIFPPTLPQKVKKVVSGRAKFWGCFATPGTECLQSVQDCQGILETNVLSNVQNLGLSQFHCASKKEKKKKTQNTPLKNPKNG